MRNELDSRSARPTPPSEEGAPHRLAGRGHSLIQAVRSEGRRHLFDDVEFGIGTELTKLEEFIRSRGIKPAHLARECGYSRQHLLRVRNGQMEPTRRCMVAITLGCRILTSEKVMPYDLFEFSIEPR